MANRTHNTTIFGAGFERKIIDRVWEKAYKTNGLNGTTTTSDVYGNIIKYDEYGQHTPNGWEIDHSKPVSENGTDHINNLQPLQWQENRTKSDQYPYRKKKLY
jgi:hypothetical protein